MPALLFRDAGRVLTHLGPHQYSLPGYEALS